MKPTLTACLSILVLAVATMHPALAKARPKLPKLTPIAPLYLYITNSVGDTSRHASTISRYVIGDGGFLHLIDTFSVPTGFDACYGKMDPSGRCFYNVQPETGDIVCYHVLKSGTLTIENCNIKHIEGRPESISFDPAGHFAYVKDYLLQFHGPHGQDATHRYGEGPFSRIWQYQIATDGNLKPQTPTWTTSEESGPQQLLFSRSGHFAYLSHTNGISQYKVDGNGTLSPLKPNSVNAPSDSRFFAVNPLGRFAYVADSQQYHQIRRYAIGDTGLLTELAPIPVPSGCAGQEVHIDPTGKYAYIVMNGDEKEIVPGKQYPIYHEYLYQFRIGQDGNFIPMDPPRIETDHSLKALGIAPDGQSLYCAFFLSNSIRHYAIHPDGTLQVLEAVPIPGLTTSEHTISIIRRILK